MKRPKKVLLLGAGGMGMAPLALYLRGAGVRVEAFDQCFSEPLRTRLINAGVKILSEPLPMIEPDCVVRSSAIVEDDPMLSFWKDRKVPVFRRGEFIAVLFKRKRIIAVVGSHGKTSVSGRLAWSFENLNFPVSYLVGGQFCDPSFSSGKYHPKSPWVLLEVDESDGTINDFSPAITVALNCDWDHVEQYHDRASFRQTLSSLFQRTKQCVISPDASELTTVAKKHSQCLNKTFNPPESPRHFIEANNRAVLAVLDFLCIPREDLNLKNFPGMKRRQSTLYEDERKCVVEDYAHHPTEICSFLQLRRELIPDSYMRVVFQPHRYSRTLSLAPSFAEELAPADQLFLLPTYAAHEKFTGEGTVEALSGYLAPRLRQNTKVFEDFGDLRRSLSKPNERGQKEQILFLGAGDINKWSNAFASWEYGRGDKHLAFGKYLENRLSQETNVVQDHPLGSMTTMRVGGSARWYAEPSNPEDLRFLVDACNLFELPRAMMGRGSNLIVPDDGFSGLVLRLKGQFWSTIEARHEESLVVGAGAKLKDICKFACRNELKGFEFLEGIPGTLGGALRMNAGAMGWEIFDLVEWVSFLLPNGEIQQIPGSELEVGYRYCREAYEGIALRAKLKSEGRAKHQEIRKVIDNLSSARQRAQPREASSGCVFRNIGNHPAGWLIDQTGLKGEAVGGASVSGVHANFIVNRGDATATEVIELICKVRQRVKESQGLILDPEVNLLGKSWDQFLS